MSGLDNEDVALHFALELWRVADESIRRHSGEEFDGPLTLNGRRMTIKGREVSTNRIVERLLASAEFLAMLEEGVDTEAATVWLNDEFLFGLTKAAERDFLDVPGVVTATQLHEWVNAQLDDGVG